MHKIQISRGGQVSNEATFESRTELDTWFDYHKSLGSFGKEAVYGDKQYLISPEVRGEVEIEVSPAELDEFGNVITPATTVIDPDGVVTPAVYETRHEVVTPAEYTYEITDVTAELAAEKLKADKIAEGKKAREASQRVLDLISGYNLDRELSISQITQLQQMMSGPEAALRAGRPFMAKQLIAAVVPDGYLVTEQMKSDALSLLSDY